MARARASRGGRASSAASSRGRKRAAQQLTSLAEDDELQAQSELGESESDAQAQQPEREAEDGEHEQEQEQEQEEEEQLRPAKRAATSRRGSAGSMDEEEEEQLFSYDVGDAVHAGLGAPSGGGEAEAEEEAEDDIEGLSDSATKKLLTKLYEPQRKKLAKQAEARTKKAVVQVIKQVLGAVSEYTKSVEENADREWSKLEATAKKMASKNDGLAVGLQAELNRVRQATAALEHDFKQLSKDFLHGLKKEREQDQGAVQKRLQGLKDDTTISFHALAEGVDQLQSRLAKAMVLQSLVPAQ